MTCVRDGKLEPIEGPGLGFELDRDVVNRAVDLYRQDSYYHHA